MNTQHTTITTYDDTNQPEKERRKTDRRKEAGGGSVVLYCSVVQSLFVLYDYVRDYCLHNVTTAHWC
jgi:hypothetical protein